MISDREIDSVRKSILVESCEDYVGLWSIVWEFRETHQEKNSSEIHRATLQVVKSLLENSFIEAGSFKDGEFEVWNLALVDTLNRINDEWKELDREPNIGEIVWFQATERGIQVVQSL